MKTNKSTVVDTIAKTNKLHDIGGSDVEMKIDTLAHRLVAGIREGRVGFDDMRVAKDIVNECVGRDNESAAAGHPSNDVAMGKAVYDGVKKMMREQGIFSTIAETFRDGY